MFGRTRAKKRAKKRAEKAVSDARMAAEAARKALRDSRSAAGGRPPGDEELTDAVQAAILGSILPVVNDAGLSKGERRRGGGSSLFVLLLGMGIGVGIAAWARREDPTEPGMQDEEWELAGGSSTKAIKSAINDTLDKADVAIRRIAQTTAEAMGSAVGSVAEAANPTAELVTDKLRVARDRATKEIIRTLDGVEDVWGDDLDEGDAPAPKPKRPTPRKPVEGKPKAAKPKPSASTNRRPAKG